MESRSCPRCGFAATPDDPSLYGLCPGCILGVAIAEPPSLVDVDRAIQDVVIPPASIAGFRILDVLGAGGGGIVYLAEQPPPLPPVVALKVLANVGFREALARFDEEQRALGRLEHPGIARIYGTGTTEDGRPYFLMEYVDGQPVTAYCEAHQLGLKERLALVSKVCETIEVAHRRGVIHRDLKPSNVLVRTSDSGPEPVVIDFGLAKFFKEEMTRNLSLPGRALGTPLYMSPEQTRADPDAVDTRTDVHALGVILYELLVGMAPFEKGDETDDDVPTVFARVRDDEPIRPSVRLAAEPALGFAGGRHDAYLREALAACRRDLDWVVIKALAKDPDRRYPSPSELAADITRHLKHQPVEARPPSATYRVGRFVRRHRVGVAATAVVVIALIAGIVGTSIGLVRAVRAERRATDEAARASREAQTSKRVSDFLVELFKSPDPNEARGNAVTAREILDRGVARIDALGDEPRVHARLVDTMGRVYRNLGLYTSAKPLLENALATRERLTPPDAIELAQSLDSMGLFYGDTGHPDDGLALFKRALQIRERDLGSEHIELAGTLNNIASFLYERGELQESIRLHERALAIREKSLPADSLDLATTRMNLALPLGDQGETERAKSLLEQARAVFETKNPDSLDLALVLLNLGVIHAEAHELDAAVPLIEGSLQLQTKILGPDHPGLTTGLINAGNLRLERHEWALARPFFERALRLLESAGVEGHRDAAFAHGSLSVVFVGLMQWDEARRQSNLAVEILTTLNGPDNPDAADVLLEYSDALRQGGRGEEADAVSARETAMRQRIEAKGTAIPRP